MDLGPLIRDYCATSMWAGPRQTANWPDKGATRLLSRERGCGRRQLCCGL